MKLSALQFCTSSATNFATANWLFGLACRHHLVALARLQNAFLHVFAGFYSLSFQSVTPMRTAPAACFTILLVITTTSAVCAQSSRSSERERAEKMRRLDEEIEKRRAEAPIPDEGTTDMNGVDLHKKRQLEIIEARLNGSNALAGKPSTKDNQYENTSNRGFTVRKFKPGKTARKEERGYAPPAVGIDPAGEPLVKSQRKFFLRQR
jgi:hypothetical protein